MPRIHLPSNVTDSEEETSDTEADIRKDLGFRHHVLPPSPPSSDFDDSESERDNNMLKVRAHLDLSPPQPVCVNNSKQKFGNRREGTQQNRNCQSAFSVNQRTLAPRRKFHFFQHDLRLPDGNEEDAKDQWVQNKKSSGDGDGEVDGECWTHDLFVEEDQQPKSLGEIIDTYGYNIRSKNPVESFHQRSYVQQHQPNRKYCDGMKAENQQISNNYGCNPKYNNNYNGRMKRMDPGSRSNEDKIDIWAWRQQQSQIKAKKGPRALSPLPLDVIEKIYEKSANPSYNSVCIPRREDKKQIADLCGQKDLSFKSTMMRYKSNEGQRQVGCESLLDRRNKQIRAHPIPNSDLNENEFHIPITLSRTVLKVLAEDDCKFDEGSLDAEPESTGASSTNIFLAPCYQLSLAPLGLSSSECESTQYEREHTNPKNHNPQPTQCLLPPQHYYYPHSQTYYSQLQGSMFDWAVYSNSGLAAQNQEAHFWSQPTMCQSMPMNISCQHNCNNFVSQKNTGNTFDWAAYSNSGLAAQRSDSAHCLAQPTMCQSVPFSVGCQHNYSSFVSHQTQGVNCASWPNWSMLTAFQHFYQESPPSGTTFRGPQVFEATEPCPFSSPQYFSP